MPDAGVSVQRLKTREQFQAVMADGAVSRTSHFVLHRCPLAPVRHGAGASDVAAHPLQLQPGIWVGALIPKRWAKRSVTRNAIRRQIYAVSEVCQSDLPGAAHVVRLRSAFDPKHYISASSDLLKSDVRSELLNLFSRATPLVTVAHGTTCAPV